MGGWGGREGIVEGVRGAREVTSSIQQHSAVLRSNNLSYSQAPTDQTLAAQKTPKREQIQNVTLLQKERQIHQTTLSLFSNSHRKAGYKRHSSSKRQIHCIRVPVGKEFNPCIRMTALIYKPIYIIL